MIDKNFWKSKKVLITGHTGFKGSWLSVWLNHMGANVIGFSLKPESPLNLYNEANISSFVDSNYGDIRNQEHLKDFVNSKNPEIIIHMAAQPLVRKSYLDPVETYQTNVMGVINLFEAARLSSSVQAIVNVTTDKCYKNNEWDWGYRENEPMGGFDPYSNSKACSELVTSSYRQSFFANSKISLASARAGNVIGGGDWAEDRLIPDMVNALFNGEEVIIRNPNAIRPWQHVLEPLSGYMLLAQKMYEEGSQYNEAWNFGPNDTDAKPVEWIVNKICNLIPQNEGWRLDTSDNPHEANYLKLDISKARNRLNWSPRLDINNAIENTINWYLSWKDGKSSLQLCLDEIEEYQLKL
jgi:CDP-glucose 4,6-dehydratase